MDGWLAAVLVTGMSVLVTATLLLTVSVMKTLAALSEMVTRLGQVGTSLAADTAETLQRTAAAAETAEARLREMEPLASGLACVGESLSEAGGQLKTLSRKTAASVNHALERARERNEPGMDHALRALDAGLTLWTAWNKRK
ncbi:hypothetical protein [Paenibacillus sp. GCM10012306]|uniref:hypothetical protein n=1 Tax=Paenibacillus sp. GCM10012306 TaxID=3317342 RepID=UPI0036220E91